MRDTTRSIVTVLSTGALAVLMTAVVSGVWSGLLLANLAATPGLPWAVIVMALVLWLLWSYLGGRWGPSRTSDARRALLRGGALPPRLMAWAVIAGVLSIVALAGVWIVLHQLVATPTNPLPDFSRLPLVTVAASLVMASISGAVSEEAGFRGYFQGALERRGAGAWAVLIAALVMAPQHALTQGFAWPNLLFYLLVDGMLGALVFATGSIRPGIVVHAIGLLTFFTLVWPHDRNRPLIWAHGADLWFWIHAAQALAFGAASLVAFVHVVRLARNTSAPARP
jgi:membrane protease YdiL (CAAX protease family)